MVQWSGICLPIQEMQVQSISQENPLKKETATHSSIPVREIPWTKEPDRLHTIHKVAKKFGHDLATRTT